VVARSFLSTNVLFFIRSPSRFFIQGQTYRTALISSRNPCPFFFSVFNTLLCAGWKIRPPFPPPSLRIKYFLSKMRPPFGLYSFTLFGLDKPRFSFVLGPILRLPQPDFIFLEITPSYCFPFKSNFCSVPTFLVKVRSLLGFQLR